MVKLEIDICIPYIGVGINLLEKQIENFIQLSSGKNKLNFKVSYHTQEDLDILQKSAIYEFISETVHAQKCEKNVPYANSVNHTNALNKLYSICSSEICVFTDYDMYFLMHDWDKEIISELNKGNFILGVNYKPRFRSIKQFTGMDLYARHYQKLPNLSFMCFKILEIKKYLPFKLSDFDEISNLQNFTPFVFINTEELQHTYQMDYGEVLWLDTGYEIPKIIYKHNLSFKVINLSEKNLITGDIIRSQQESEFFLLNDKNFLAHYKKGTYKSSKKNDDFDKFYQDIQHLIN